MEQFINWSLHNLDLVGLIMTNVGNLMGVWSDDNSSAFVKRSSLLMFVSVTVVVALRGNPGPY